MARPSPPTPRSILITGASSGIGAALARRYAQTRYPSGAWRPRSEPAAVTAAACRQGGADVSARTVDVTDRPAMTDWISGVDQDAPLDLVIANAGTAGRDLPDGPERTRAIFTVNLDGVLNTIEPAEAAMVRRGSGHLALMSSLASFHGSPNSAAYCGSKAAVRLLGEGLRQRLARKGIVVSVICPGFVRTPMNAGVHPRLPLTMSADRAAAIVARGLARGSARIAFPFVTYMAVRLLGALPPALAGRLKARRSETA